MRYPRVKGTQKLEEAVVMRCHACDECLVAVGCKYGQCVDGDVYHCLRSKRRDWCFVPVKLTLYFFVCSQVAILSRGLKHIEGILSLWDHPALTAFLCGFRDIIPTQ